MKLKIISIHRVSLVLFLLNLLFIADAIPVTKQNNEQDVVYLINKDFDVSKDDINYYLVSKKTESRKNEEIRARIISLVWGKTQGKVNLRPLSLSKGDEYSNKWKNYIVLLTSNYGDNIVKKVCFPNDLKENYGIVLNRNKRCSKYMAKFYENNNVQDVKPILKNSTQNKVNSDKKFKERKSDSYLVPSIEPSKTHNKILNSDHKNDISGDSLNEKSDIKDNLNGNYYNQHENDGFTFDKTENKLNKKKSLLKINDDKNHYYDAQMNKKPVLKDKYNPVNHLENNKNPRKNKLKSRLEIEISPVFSNVDKKSSQKPLLKTQFNQHSSHFNIVNSNLDQESQKKSLVNSKVYQDTSHFNTLNSNYDQDSIQKSHVNSKVDQLSSPKNTVKSNLDHEFPDSELNNDSNVEKKANPEMGKVNDIGNRDSNVGKKSYSDEKNNHSKLVKNSVSSNEISNSKSSEIIQKILMLNPDTKVKISKYNKKSEIPNLKTKRSPNLNELNTNIDLINHSNLDRIISNKDSDSKLDDVNSNIINIKTSEIHQPIRNIGNKDIKSRLTVKKSRYSSASNENINKDYDPNYLNSLAQPTFDTIGNDNEKLDKTNLVSQNSLNNHQEENLVMNKDKITKKEGQSRSEKQKFSSFIETRRKDQMINQISKKFSVDELRKIKSLIKFSRKNDLLEKILAKKGEVTIGEITRENFIKNMSSIFSNATEEYSKENKNINQEIRSLKFMQIVQQAKLNSYFSEMNENVNTIKELMIFTKNFNTQFKNQIINFGSKLKDVNNQMRNLDNKINKLNPKASYLSDFIDEQAKIKDKQMIQMNNDILKGCLKNTTKGIIDDYKQTLKNEVLKMFENFKNQSNVIIKNKTKTTSQKIIEEKIKNQISNKEEEKNEDTKPKENEEKPIKNKKEKIKTEEIQSSTFSNEDAFDDAIPSSKLSSEKAENNKNHGEIDYSEKLW